MKPSDNYFQNNLYPVYTVPEECRDCYKCVRHCPVKAIGVKDDHAYIMPYYCIACGKCFTVCPKNAKHVRDDVDKVKHLLANKREVYVSISASWMGLFGRYTKNQIIHSLMSLGFAGVSETALGAEEYCAFVADDFRANNDMFQISSHCPAVVDYIRMYKPEFRKYITKSASPSVIHAKMLREKYGDDIGVVFIGPCMAKKNESDRNPNMLNAALTFEKMFNWFRKENINIDSIPNNIKADFVPHKCHEGALYTIPGGFNKILEINGIPDDVQLISINGMEAIKDALRGLRPETLNTRIFIEALACEGGCINGPCRGMKKSNISILSNIVHHTDIRERENRKFTVSIKVDYENDINTIEKFSYTLEQMSATMVKIGKHSLKEELNCGGCGYDSCRHLAQAIIRDNAEPIMCVTYMRENAEKKANAMLRSMPAGVVIANKNLKIIEINKAFHNMFGKELSDAFTDDMDAMIGFSLERFIPCGDLFNTVLAFDKDIRKEMFHIGNEIYDINIFPIESNSYIGVIITNVTGTEMRREDIKKRAQQIISKNITTVQEIASLLGEHMVETELLLSSIAEDGKNPGGTPK